MGNSLMKRTTIMTVVMALALVLAHSVMAAQDAYGPGRIDLKLISGGQAQEVGGGGIWNSIDKLHIQLEPSDSWRIKGYHIDAGGEADYSPPLTNSGNPKIGRFAFTEEFPPPYQNADSDEGCFKRTIVLEMEGDLAFQWGTPYAELRTQGVAIFVELVRLDDAGMIVEQAGAWAVPEVVYEEAEAEEGETTAAEDEEVADDETGEVVATVTAKTKGGRGAVAHGTHRGGQQNTVLTEDEALMEFDGARWGWWFTYEMAHPMRGHFIDSPVSGLTVETPTYEGVTGIDAAFDYFPGEYVELSLGNVFLGTAPADHKISPLDVFELSDTDEPRVANMARLLQSLDVDGQAQGTIVITEEVIGAFESAAAEYFEFPIEAVDFSSDDQVDYLINATIAKAAALDPAVTLYPVSAEDAVIHLSESLNTVMFRKNVSKSPALESSKAKMNIMTVWFPARKANGDDTVVEYFDENGDLIRTATEAKPVIITYTDAHPETGEHDTYAAISRDDGTTWKRMNLSRTADLSSFTLANGTDYYGGVKKPVFQVKGNKILVAWSSKYCRGGKPGYAIDPEDDYTFDDPYYQEDIWGVSGPQRSHDYTGDGFPEVGEVPFASLWVCRGTIVTQGMIDSSAYWANYGVGDIVWFKPERLTSGRRDVNQIFVGAGDGAGFGIVWQEDPNGVRPGRAVGPGPGWGGATTSHKTDIWYSYLTMEDHSKIDANFVSGGDPDHEMDVLERPKALVPMSLPVRLSDNEVVNTDNIMVELDDEGYPVEDENGNYIPLTNPDTDGDGDGTHAYAYRIPGLIDKDGAYEPVVGEFQDGFYEYENQMGETKKVAVTEDGRLLDGDTGASRGNIFLQPYTKPDGTKSAWAIITYEETKGAGAGPPEDGENEDNPDEPGSDDYLPEEGKNVIYHSFDFQNPEVVSAGTIINQPEFEYTDTGAIDEYGNPVYSLVTNSDGFPQPRYLMSEPDVDGGQTNILDWLGNPQLAYENARRGRFILQGKSAAGASNTVMLMVYKQGPEGSGRPSDILMRRWVASTPGNPYDVNKIYSEEEGGQVTDPISGTDYWASGVVNMSSVTPTVTTESQGDPEVDDAYGAVKVVEWEQTEANLNDPSWLNRFDDARAHRGQIRGDFVQLGFSYTANWAAARNGNDKYDFFIRRSFDGGQTWTTDPDSEEDVEHCYTWTDPVTKEKTEVCTVFAPGDFESMRNLSQLPNNKESVIEPRIVAVPGTIKVDGVWTGIAEDKQNPDVFYVAYGTSTNPKKDPVTGEQEEPAPKDLFWSVSDDRGQTYLEIAWEYNGTEEYSGGAIEGELRWDFMAKGDPEQGEVQLRETPDGSRFYASWLDEGEEGSDIIFRRIMPNIFEANVAEDADPEGEGDTSSSEESQADSGGE